MRTFGLFSVCLLLIASMVARANSKLDCYRLFYDHRFPEAFRACEVAASEGHAYGKYLLGVMIAQGRVREKNEAEGVELIALAAEAGISDAQRDLGSAYQTGVGISTDYIKAIYWYKKSIASKNLLAMVYLGGMYIAGQGVSPDVARGYAYILLAADRGNSKAKEAIERLNSLPEVTPKAKKDAALIFSELSREIRD